MSAPMKKVSLSVPPHLVADLDHVSGRLGISRSALVSQLLDSALPDMRRLIDLIPPAPSAADLVRFRGESADVVRSRVESVRQSADDLFSGE